MLPLISFIALISCRTDEKVNADTITEEPTDLDGDGYFGEEDCDDDNPAIHIGATEICDGVDNNCDGQIDEGVLSTYYIDADGDGFGSEDESTQACAPPDGYVLTTNDCNDQNPNIYPGSDEQCDALNTTLCASGGAVSGSAVHGVFCFAPADAAAAPPSSNTNHTWQPGPFTRITK